MTNKWIENDSAMDLALERGDTEAAKGGLLDYIATMQQANLTPDEEKSALKALLVEMMLVMDLKTVGKLRDRLQDTEPDVNALTVECQSWLDAWGALKKPQ